MRLKTAFFTSVLYCSTALAGGILTNTNQNVVFNRNMARDGAIGIDGVYSNPAGVAFLNDGFHLSLNLQNAHQTREILSSYGPLFALNMKDPAQLGADGMARRLFKGNADAPIIPSLQAAYNKNRWSFQFGFAVVGGGGKCEFPNGLGSFEGLVGSTIMANSATVNNVFQQLGAAGIPGMSGHELGNGYSFDSYMRGRQYYYGFTLGAARKLTDNLSVYGGLRMLYGRANYYGYVKNINVQHIENGQSTMMNASQHFAELSAQLYQTAGVLESMGNPAASSVEAAAAGLQQFSLGTQDIMLNCDQEGWGVAPIVGIDYKMGKLNLGAKYEFKTRMRLKNTSANSQSAEGVALLDKFADGNKVAEDSPSLLTVGAQYEILPSLRVMAGWHHYFDVDTEQFTKSQLSDTNEYLFGAEYDITKRVQVSAGCQKTQYGFEDNFMNDISFNVNSYSYGFGVGVQVSDMVKINAAYFQTNYEDYDKNESINGVAISNTFTRSNRVFGIGVDLTF